MVGVVGVLFVTTACIGEVTPPQQTSTGVTESGNGVTLRRSALVREMSIEDLTREASIVVAGTIREVSAGRWSTPDGKRPSGPLRGGPDAPIIFREALLQVEEYIKGSFGAKELTIHLEGGQVGTDNMWVEDQVSLDPGEKVLVFLSPDTSPELAGRPGYAVRGSFQGKYKITGGLAVGGATNSSIPLNDLTARIKSAMANWDALPADALESDDKSNRGRCHDFGEPAKTSCHHPSGVSAASDRCFLQGSRQVRFDPILASNGLPLGVDYIRFATRMGNLPSDCTGAPEC